MTNHLTTASPDTDVHQAARIMAEHQIPRLPVVENNNLVGMVAIGDLAVQNIYQNEQAKRYLVFQLHRNLIRLASYKKSHCLNTMGFFYIKLSALNYNHL